MGASESKWSEDSIGDCSGKVVVITGANSGLGWESARALYARNATVVFTGRSEKRVHEAAESIRALYPSSEGVLEEKVLDLASLDSIRAFADWFGSAKDGEPYGAIDVLLLNAGVMALPTRESTAEGFEMQIGVNHLGHFALAGLLFAHMRGMGRIVSVSSEMHRTGGRVDVEDLFLEKRGYSAWTAYSRSKAANLLFVLELTRRLKAAGSGVMALAAHPGYSATNLQEGKFPLAWVANALVAQPASMGALPQLYAAVAEDIAPGQFYGPDGLYGGHPTTAVPDPLATEEDTARKLWVKSQTLTKVHFLRQDGDDDDETPEEDEEEQEEDGEGRKDGAAAGGGAGE